MYVTTARNGNAYVTDIFSGHGGGICVYRYMDGEYGSCERLSGGVNRYRSAHPLISPDERFLVFDAYGPDAIGGSGDDDFYISVRLEDGTWSDPAHLMEISTPAANMTASLSPDGRYVFYYANHDIYWVSSEILEPYLTSSGEAEP
jgi:Tol biopolymer transport system component